MLTGNVRCVGDYSKDVLHDFNVVGLVKDLSGLLILSNILQQLEQNLQADLGDVTHRVLERPDDGVEHELELWLLKLEQSREAVLIDRLQEHEEVLAVLRELLEVAVDHEQRALEHGVEYLGHLFGDAVLELVDNGGHGGEHLGLARLRYVLLVVEEDGVEQRRYEVLHDHLRVV